MRITLSLRWESSAHPYGDRAKIKYAIEIVQEKYFDVKHQRTPRKVLEKERNVLMLQKYKY